MLKIAIKIILLTAFMITTGQTWAKLPPPPVNQNLGIPDGKFSDMTFQTCLVCHGDPESAPAPVKTGYLPDRHHLRVDTPIDMEFTASQYPEKSPDGTHKCITCHLIDWVEDTSRPLGGYFAFAEEPSSPQFRDCLNCHEQKKRDGKLIATVHHLTDKAQKKLCHTCHGSLVNDATGEHRIPDPVYAPDPGKARRCGEVASDGDRNFYDISMITPWPGDNYDSENWIPMLKFIFSDCPDFGERYYNPEVLDGQFNINPPRYRYEKDTSGKIKAILVPDGVEGGRRTGNCEHCHFGGENPGDAVQAGTGLAKSDIGTNMSNHHSTGVGQPGSGSVHGCDLCHAPFDPPDYTIRGCEVCHGISTLHAIEFDAEGDGINIGQDPPFMGHVGNTLNCNGCHLNYRSGNTYRAASARSLDEMISFPGTAANISEINVTVAIEGKETEIFIKGTSLNGPSTRLELTGTDGRITEVAMLENDFTSARTTLPKNIVADNYELSVVRGRGGYAVYSPTISFLVTRETRINSALCDDGTVTITGSGFGDKYVDGANNLGIYDESSVYCSVDSWSDNRVVASCSEGISGITINGLFGKASSDIDCNGTGNGRPSWWSIWSWWSLWGWGGR